MPCAPDGPFEVGHPKPPLANDPGAVRQPGEGNLTTRLTQLARPDQVEVGEFQPLQLRSRRIHPQDPPDLGYLAILQRVEYQADPARLRLVSLAQPETVGIEEGVRQQRTRIRGVVHGGILDHLDEPPGHEMLDRKGLEGRRLILQEGACLLDGVAGIAVQLPPVADQRVSVAGHLARVFLGSQRLAHLFPYAGGRLPLFRSDLASSSSRHVQALESDRLHRNPDRDELGEVPGLKGRRGPVGVPDSLDCDGVGPRIARQHQESAGRVGEYPSHLRSRAVAKDHHGARNRRARAFLDHDAGDRLRRAPQRDEGCQKQDEGSGAHEM